MAALPRGNCPVCGRDVALRKGGRVREHVPAIGRGRVCMGSGRLVEPRQLTVEECIAHAEAEVAA